MPLIDTMHATVSAFVAAIVAKTAWSPLGRGVTLALDDSADPELLGRSVRGVIRAYDIEPPGCPRCVLVQLAEPIEYRRSAMIDFVVVIPCLRWHRMYRLPFTWVAARVVAASSFREVHYRRTIGIGRLWLSDSQTRNARQA